MSSSSLVLHRGARPVTLEEVRACPTPPATASHFPIPFARTLEIALDALRGAGFEPARQALALHGESRFFAVIDLKSVIAEGVTLAAALRSSHDRSLPYGYVVGGRVFCCDNLSLSSDLSKMIRVKHSRFGEPRFVRGMERIVRALPQFVENESRRVAMARRTEVSDERAESLILRSLERGVIGQKQVLRVLREYRTPSFDEFAAEGKTLWRLENAYTTCLGDALKRSPERYSRASIALQGLLYGAYDGRGDRAA